MASNNPIWLIVVGLGILILGSWFVYVDYSATTWNIVQGRILNSSVSSEYYRTTHSSGWAYRANIQYNYSIEGSSYMGSCCNTKTSDAGAANEMSGKHPAGSQAAIFVNPQNPYQSRLKDDVQPFNWIYLFIIVFGLLFIIAVGYSIFRRNN